MSMCEHCSNEFSDCSCKLEKELQDTNDRLIESECAFAEAKEEIERQREEIEELKEDLNTSEMCNKMANMRNIKTDQENERLQDAKDFHVETCERLNKTYHEAKELLTEAEEIVCLLIQTSENENDMAACVQSIERGMKKSKKWLSKLNEWNK